jgi:hypothetical protein
LPEIFQNEIDVRGESAAQLKEHNNRDRINPRYFMIIKKFTPINLYYLKLKFFELF